MNGFVKYAHHQSRIIGDRIAKLAGTQKLILLDIRIQT